MSADERLREAARVLRERAKDATPAPWEQTGLLGKPYNDIVDAPDFGYIVCECDTKDGDAAYIATVHPGVGLGFADWLDDIATRHAPDPEPIELVHMDEPCEVCQDSGQECIHERIVCTGCYPSWEGLDGHAIYPCAETCAALAVADAILGGTP